MEINFRSFINILLWLFVGSAILYLVFESQDLNKIYIAIKTANYGFVLLSAIIVLVAHFFRALRWQLLMQSLGDNVSLKAVFNAIMVGYLANLALPRLGEASRCAVLKNKSSLNFPQLIGTVITERIIDLISLIVLLFFAIVIEFNLFFEAFKLISFPSKSNFFFILLCIVVISFIITLYFYKAGNRLSLKFKEIFNQFRVGISSIFLLKSKSLFTAYSIIIWFLYTLSIFIAFYALRQTSNLNFETAFLILIFGSLGMIVPVQGGIGAFHFMVSQCLLYYNLNITTGLSFATIIHSSQILVTIVIGFYSLYSLLHQSKKIIKYETVRSN